MKKSIIIIMMALIVCSMFGTAAIYERAVIEGEGENQVTVTVKEYTGIHKLLKSLGLLSVSVYPSVPIEGENFKVVFGGAFPDGCTNPYGRFEVWNSDNVIVRKATLENLPCSGSSIMLDAEFVAPDEGSYRTFFEIRNKDLMASPICIRQEKSFEVKKEVTDCPNDYCDNWDFVASVYGGDLYERYCYEYGSAPSCTQDSKYEEKKVCKNGFYLSNGNCIKEEDEDESNEDPVVTETTDSEFGILRTTYPTVAEKGERIAVKMSFKAEETREYYLEAGFTDQPLAMIGSDASLCDGNPHWSGIKVQANAGETIDVEFTPTTYDKSGKYSLIFGAYTDCLSNGGEVIDKEVAYVDVGNPGPWINWTTELATGTIIILGIMAASLIGGTVLLVIAFKKK